MNATVMTQRSAAPTPASVLTLCLIESNGCGCSPAAMVQPPTRKTGVTAEETTPHHGTPRISTTVRESPRWPLQAYRNQWPNGPGWPLVAPGRHSAGAQCGYCAPAPRWAPLRQGSLEIERLDVA